MILDLHPILNPLYPLYSQRHLERRPACARRVQPYRTPVTWWLRGPHRHFIDALREQPAVFRGEVGKRLQRRLRSMVGWLRFRAVVLLILSASLAATALGVVSNYIDGFAAAERAFGTLTTLSSSFATGFALLYLLSRRTLDQLRADADVLLAMQASQGRLHQ